MSSWQWSSSSGGCPSGTQRQTIRTVAGQRIITTTYSNVPSQCNMYETSPTPAPAAVTNSGGPSGDSAGSTFEQECLDAHNRYRAMHGCPPLKLSRNLCNYAAEWARHLSNTRSMTHRTTRTYGENLFMASGSAVNGATAVKAWYDEIGQYNFSRPGFSGSTGHFTQVVWKSSTEVGFAIERSGGSTWVVANYNPPGNFGNQFPQNVPQKIR